MNNPPVRFFSAWLGLALRTSDPTAAAGSSVRIDRFEESPWFRWIVVPAVQTPLPYDDWWIIRNQLSGCALTLGPVGKSGAYAVTVETFVEGDQRQRWFLERRGQSPHMPGLRAFESDRVRLWSRDPAAQGALLTMRLPFNDADPLVASNDINEGLHSQWLPVANA
jgi:hypothetical protein